MCLPAEEPDALARGPAASIIAAAAGGGGGISAVIAAAAWAARYQALLAYFYHTQS